MTVNDGMQQECDDKLTFKMENFFDKLDTIDFREYQENIAKIAIEQNTMVILPTAMGKTIIALMVAIKRLKRYPRGKVIFLAPTRPLVSQHLQTFRTFLKMETDGKELFKGVELSGRTFPKYRSWAHQNANIIFATPQTLKNDLDSGAYSLKDCVLMIFDECHKAGKNYAYTHVARHFLLQNLDPLILGLTASPGRDVDSIVALCQRLFIEKIVIRTDDDDDVQPYIHDIQVDVHDCELPIEIEVIADCIKDMIHKVIKEIQDEGLLLEKLPNEHTKMDLISLGKALWFAVRPEYKGLEKWSIAAEIIREYVNIKGVGYFFKLINLQSRAVKLMHLLELITTQDYHSAMMFINRMKLKGNRVNSANYLLLNDKDFQEIINLISTAIDKGKSHPKIDLLGEIIDEKLYFAKESTNNKIIIFTQYRDTACKIKDYIDSLNDFMQESINPSVTLKRYRPIRFIGQASKYKDPGLSQKEQARYLKEFREGKYNILIATRIAEEGLDIPDVQDIIFYEPVPSEIRYIQRKGRTGRHDDGNVTILVTKKTLDEVFLHVSSNRFKKMLANVRVLENIALDKIKRSKIIFKENDPEGKKAGIELLNKRRELILGQERQFNNINPKTFKSPFFLDDETLQKQVKECGITSFNSLFNKEGNNSAFTFTKQDEFNKDVSSNSVNWHELLKKMRPKTKKEPKSYRLKRTRKEFPRTRSGKTIYNKTMRWIYDQLISLGMDMENNEKVIEVSELREMAEFEELDMDDFDYNLSAGSKKGYWNINGDKVIVSLEG
ncbi:MAG: DEAD/DEAH box helicase family protein [Promethearchaeota archaeon]